MGTAESDEKKWKRLNDEDYHQKWENGTDESDEKEGKSSTGNNLKTMIAAELSSSEDDEWRGGGRRVWRSMRQGHDKETHHENTEENEERKQEEIEEEHKEERNKDDEVRDERSNEQSEDDDCWSDDVQRSQLPAWTTIGEPKEGEEEW